jgi:sigma-B regulation protein RsbU (phosphoserine phosphatase)
MPSKEQTNQIKDQSLERQKNRERQADLLTLAREAEARAEWESAANWYSQAIDQRSAELALINSVQEGLSSRLEMQAIYDLVGDSLRDTFNAQVVMISQYDPLTNRIFHHYAIERGRHLHISGWHPIDSSRLAVVRTGKPFMINKDEIIRVLEAQMMHVIPGTEVPKTWLGVPIMVGNEAMGIVSLQNLDKENAFSASDIGLLNTLTNSMSLSLENARLFNETQRLLRVLEQEMAFARQTQQSILPRHLPSHPGYDFGAMIRPARAVGGDFYDFIYLDDEKLGIVVGDVSGKGLPAALVMALTFSLVRSETGRTQNPRQILKNVNRHLIHMNANNMFVTLLLCILDCKTGAFSYSRAGHLPPIVVHQDGRVVDFTINEGQLLGIFEDIHIDEKQCVIPDGGLVLMYSDGLNEAANSQGIEFGKQRIKNVLVTHRLEKAQSICENLWTAILNYSDQNSYQDDFTALIIKRA